MVSSSVFALQLTLYGLVKWYASKTNMPMSLLSKNHQLDQIITTRHGLSLQPHFFPLSPYYLPFDSTELCSALSMIQTLFHIYDVIESLFCMEPSALSQHLHPEGVLLIFPLLVSVIGIFIENNLASYR